MQKNKKFKHPRVNGIISAKGASKNIGKGDVCLLLRTKVNQLKNVPLALRLMDIEEAFVGPEFEKKICPFLKLDSSAVNAGKVNIIVNSVGYYLPNPPKLTQK